MSYRYKFINSPIGRLKLIASDRGLAGVLWENDDPERVRLEPQSFDDQDPMLVRAETQLTEYFAGQRTVFDLEMDFKGTPFQKAVWNELLNIPFGKTSTYGEIARLIGNPKAVRAVGAANGKNPISIIAPCHRVIGQNRSLTGFAGGLAAKAALLKLESDDKSDSPQVLFQL